MAAAPAATATAFLFSSNPNHTLKSKPLITALKPHVSNSSITLLSNFRSSPALTHSLYLTRRGFGARRRCSAVQDIPVEEEKKEPESESVNGSDAEDEKRRKLYVVNFPWDFSAPEIEKLFGEHGTVKDVEIIKQKNGKSRGFAFITMASSEEARAVIAKFDAFELNGRIIRVEFAKSFRKPSPPSQPGPPAKTEGRYKIYASNLAWKVRANNLREFFSEKFKPISARVVFDSPTGRSSGYGFVGFDTMDEVEAAVSELDGKELMGRPLRLKVSQRVGDESGEDPEEAVDNELQSPDP